jgi:hypothetical protein
VQASTGLIAVVRRQPRTRRCALSKVDAREVVSGGLAAKRQVRFRLPLIRKSLGQEFVMLRRLLTFKLSNTVRLNSSNTTSGPAESANRLSVPFKSFQAWGRGAGPDRVSDRPRIPAQALRANRPRSRKRYGARRPVCRPGLCRFVRGNSPPQFHGFQPLHSRERHAPRLDFRDRCQSNLQE